MENKTKMIYDLIKQVKETGVGADGTVVCSMDELVALVDYAEEIAYDDGYDNGYVDGCNHSDDYDEEDDYEEDYDDYEEEEIDEDEPTLEDLFKEFVAMYMAKGR